MMHLSSVCSMCLLCVLLCLIVIGISMWEVYTGTPAFKCRHAMPTVLMTHKPKGHTAASYSLPAADVVHVSSVCSMC
jgi:hypothetical protein